VKWAIYGSPRHDYHGDEEEKCLATFDDEGAAKKYEVASKLKRPTWRKFYRDKSVLCGYECIDIRPYEYPDVPHNPEMK
jgi:hypothetical protein